MAADALSKRIWAAVRRIPRGKIATYGEIAARIGLVAGHRRVARAMTVCPPGLPWHRVVGKKDARRATIRILEPRTAAEQRARLEREGVEIDENGAIALARFGWGR